MREILFRAKAINRKKGFEYRTTYKNGDWVYGLVSRLNREYPNGSLPMEMTNTDGISGIEVDYTTVCQYTGLTDKNGTKIFEGDIVRQQSFGQLNPKYDSEKAKKDHKKHLIKRGGAIFDDEEHYHKNYDWVVEFREARFYPFADDNFEWGGFDWDTPFEVIGNIHDNKELLGE